MEAARVPSQLLGELFVEKGLITPEELDEALAEQKASGKRLGAILVKKGYVSGPALTTVLAEQLGVEMEKQEGYGSGLWSEIKRRHPRGKSDEVEAPQEPPHSATAFERRLALIDGMVEDDGGQQPVDWEKVDEAARAELEGLRQQLTFTASSLDEERAAHKDAQRYLEEARAEAERLSQEADELRERAARAEDSSAANTPAAADLTQLEETVAQLRTDLAARDVELADGAEARTDMEAEVARLQADLNGLREQHSAAEAAAAGAAEELGELRAGFAAREAELASNAAAKAALEAEVARLDADLDELREQRSAADMAAAEAHDRQLNELREELAAREEARAREVDARVAAEAEAGAEAARARELAVEAEELRQLAPRASELERELGELRGLLEDEQARAAAADDLARELGVAREELRQLAPHATELERELGELRRLLENARTQAAAAHDLGQELGVAQEEVARLTQLTHERDEALARESERRAVVESQLADLSVGADALNDRFQQEFAVHVETRREPGRVEADLAELQPLAATESGLAACARLLEEVSESLAAAKMDLRERDFADADQSRHLVFMPIEGVYALAERPGPAPEAGADEEVDGVRFRVTRIGHSPLPADKRRCAFLEVAQPSRDASA